MYRPITGADIDGPYSYRSRESILSVRGIPVAAISGRRVTRWSQDMLKYVSARAAHRVFCSGNARETGALSYVIANNLMFSGMAYASILNPPPLTERVALEAGLSFVIVCLGSIYVYQKADKEVRQKFLEFFFVMNVPLTVQMFVAVTGILFGMAYVVTRIDPGSMHLYPGLETATIVAGLGYIFLRMANFGRMAAPQHQGGWV